MVAISIFFDLSELIVQSINVLTINEKAENETDVINVIETAKDYFPVETWGIVQYLGKVSLEHDVKIVINEESLGAFLFERLIRRIRKMKDSDKFRTLLLGLTPDPIIALSYFFDGINFRRTSYVVHDYITEKVGIVSMFRVKNEKLCKVVAHGLGHNRGLCHHLKPVDLMHPELLRFPAMKLGFCKDCLRKLSEG